MGRGRTTIGEFTNASLRAAEAVVQMMLSREHAPAVVLFGIDIARQLLERSYQEKMAPEEWALVEQNLATLKECVDVGAITLLDASKISPGGSS